MIKEHCRSNCAHLDCFESRQPKCVKCNKKIADTKEIYLLMVRNVSQPTHIKCSIKEI